MPCDLFLSSHLLPHPLHSNLPAHQGASKVFPQSALLPAALALVLPVYAVDGGSYRLWLLLQAEHVYANLLFLLAVDHAPRFHHRHPQLRHICSAGTPLLDVSNHKDCV